VSVSDSYPKCNTGADDETLAFSCIWFGPCDILLGDVRERVEASGQDARVAGGSIRPALNVVDDIGVSGEDVLHRRRDAQPGLSTRLFIVRCHCMHMSLSEHACLSIAMLCQRSVCEASKRSTQWPRPHPTTAPRRSWHSFWSASAPLPLNKKAPKRGYTRLVRTTYVCSLNFTE
jgi:hypothetical protein